MPHKHTRRRDEDDTNFNLAPSNVAKPLPAFQAQIKAKRKGSKQQIQQTPQHQKQERQHAKSKPKRNVAGYGKDDTPRAFARLMEIQAGKRRRSGLDDGQNYKNKKHKIDQQISNIPPQPTQEQPEMPRIQPGERLGDFAARVDRALPIGGLTRKGIKVEGVKERQTKAEKRLHKMYAEWRTEDAKRKDRLEELQELEEEAQDEKEAELGGQSIILPAGRRAKRRKLIGESLSDDDDPWAVLKTKREAPKGLHDVVQAPPTLKTVPREIFSVKGGAKVNVANIPASAGSLKRREELSNARKEVIERYRRLMKGGE